MFPFLSRKPAKRANRNTKSKQSSKTPKPTKEQQANKNAVLYQHPPNPIHMYVKCPVTQFEVPIDNPSFFSSLLISLLCGGGPSVCSFLFLDYYYFCGGVHFQFFVGGDPPMMFCPNRPKPRTNNEQFSPEAAFGSGPRAGTGGAGRRPQRQPGAPQDLRQGDDHFFVFRRVEV